MINEARILEPGGCCINQKALAPTLAHQGEHQASHVRTNVHTYVRMYDTYIYIYIYTNTCIHIYIYIYIYICNRRPGGGVGGDLRRGLGFRV